MFRSRGAGPDLWGARAEILSLTRLLVMTKEARRKISAKSVLQIDHEATRSGKHHARQELLFDTACALRRHLRYFDGKVFTSNTIIHEVESTQNVFSLPQACVIQAISVGRLTFSLQALRRCACVFHGGVKPPNEKEFQNHLLLLSNRLQTLAIYDALCEKCGSCESQTAALQCADQDLGMPFSIDHDLNLNVVPWPMTERESCCVYSLMTCGRLVLAQCVCIHLHKTLVLDQPKQLSLAFDLYHYVIARARFLKILLHFTSTQ